MSFTVFSYNATVLIIQPTQPNTCAKNATQPNPTQPMDGPNPCPSLVYCSPIADVILHHGVQYHQYADDTQLHLAMRADDFGYNQTLTGSDRTGPAWPGPFRSQNY